MSNPRIPGAGITGAWISSLGSGSTKSYVARAGACFNDRMLCATVLDRQADFWLSVGRHDAAERLSHQAADLRGAAAI
jgi:hypothetical protein